MVLVQITFKCYLRTISINRYLSNSILSYYDFLQAYDGYKSSKLKRSAWLSKSYCLNWYDACLINLKWYAILYKIMMLCYIEYLSIYHVWDFLFIRFIWGKGGNDQTHL